MTTALGKRTPRWFGSRTESGGGCQGKTDQPWGFGFCGDGRWKSYSSSGHLKQFKNQSHYPRTVRHGGDAAFCSRRPRKLTPPPLSAPLKLIKFRGSKKKKIRYTNFGCSGRAPHRAGFCLLFCSAKDAKTRGKPRVCPDVCFNHRPPEFTKFPMPAARHENKRIPAMRCASRLGPAFGVCVFKKKISPFCGLRPLYGAWTAGRPNAPAVRFKSSAPPLPALGVVAVARPARASVVRKPRARASHVLHESGPVRLPRTFSAV